MKLWNGVNSVKLPWVFVELEIGLYWRSALAAFHSTKTETCHLHSHYSCEHQPDRPLEWEVKCAALCDFTCQWTSEAKTLVSGMMLHIHEFVWAPIESLIRTSLFWFFVLILWGYFCPLKINFELCKTKPIWIIATASLCYILDI